MASSSGKPLPTVQLIDGQGFYNEAGLAEFARAVRLPELGLSYAVVAIMGPQSSGKSTLLNHLFGTRFTEMDAMRGRRQTTQGIWMAQAAGIEPCTLVMDLEGTDGRERGEDDTTFEKQSSLFALAVADVILVNMWCHDIGREHAANKPLLKTVFQVMMRLFSPRKATLLFVIRDKTKTPMETLEPILREDIQRIWDGLPKTEQHLATPLSDFFNVEVTWLPNFEEREEEFEKQVALLRRRFHDSISSGGIAGDRRGVVPGTALGLSMKEMWRVIKDNRDLDLPAHKVMVATVRCEQIAKEKLDAFTHHEEWVEADAAVAEAPLAGFGPLVSRLVAQTLAEYDLEAAFFEERVRAEKREELTGKLREVIHPVHTSLTRLLATSIFEKFESRFIDATGGDDGSAAKFAESARECSESALRELGNALADAEVPGISSDTTELQLATEGRIRAAVEGRRQAKLQQIMDDGKEFLTKAVSEPIAALLEAAAPDAWSDIRHLLKGEVEAAKAQLVAAVAGFEMEEDEVADMVADVAAAGRMAVEAKMRQEAQHALALMKDRFISVFTHDEHAMPRRWSEKEDVRAITREARLSALNLLSMLAVIRLDENRRDNVHSLLLTLLGDASSDSASAASSASTSAAATNGEGRSDESSAEAVLNAKERSRESFRAMSLGGALTASQWNKVPPEDTLLSPSQCRSLWIKLKADTQYTISQALQAQEASKRGSSWLPPPWAIVAMVILGFNEFVALVRNPLWLLLVTFFFLLGRALWNQLNAPDLFQNGLVPGLLALSARIVPAVISIFRKLVEEGQQQLGEVQDRLGRSPARERRSGEVQMEGFGVGDEGTVGGGGGFPGYNEGLRRRGRVVGDGE